MASTTANVTLPPQYYLPLSTTSNTLIFAVLGVAGNGLIIFTTFIKRYVKSTSSVLIAILALFDLGSNVGMFMVEINVVQSN